MATKMTRNLVSRTETPQTEAIPGREAEMKKNNAGGVTFVVDDWKRLERFLILGAEGGTYYASEQKLVRENAAVVERCLKADGPRTIRTIVDVSDKGRAPKNDQAIFALGMALKLGDVATKKAAASAVVDVCRIGTHIFQLAETVKAFGGWGRVTKRAFANWYNTQVPNKLAMNLVKYQNRNGWSHADLLSKAHITPGTPDHEALFRWVTRDGDLSAREVKRFKKGSKTEVKRTTTYGAIDKDTLPDIIGAFEKAKRATDEKEIVKLITDYGLPRECIPTQFLNSVKVWEALLHAGTGMPFTAMIRNLGKMSEVGLLAPMSDSSKFVRTRLADGDGLKKARVHPISILVALSTYNAGHGLRGNLTWNVDSTIADALDDAFYKAFDLIEPTGKRHLLGLDVSGSMASGHVNGIPLTPRETAAAMAMVVARTEKDHHFFGFSNTFMELKITAKMTLPQVLKATSGLPFQGTDCSLPMIYALERKIPVDAFLVYTDNETWAGRMQPVQALKQYREKMGIDAKLIVVGMTATEFTIADPKDPGMLDVVGFDTAAPAVMADFIR